jgi:hypothetical protein
MSRRNKRTKDLPSYHHRGKDRVKRRATLERYGRKSESKEDEIRAWFDVLEEWEEKSGKAGARVSRRRGRKRPTVVKRKRKNTR